MDCRKNSTLAISTIGVKRNEEQLKLWEDGVREMIERLTPERIIVYGGELDYDYGDIEVIYFQNEVTERMKLIGKNLNR